MKRLSAVAALVLLPIAAAASAAGECTARLKPARAMQAERDGYAVAFAPRPAPLATGRHFALDIAVCPPAGGSAPRGLRVDADMPAHQHGMNYRASITTRGAGLYRAEGLLLHMPGRWRFLFDLQLDDRVLQLAHEVEVP